MASGDFLDLAQRACYAAQRDPDLASDLTRAKEAVNEAVLSVVTNGDPWDFLQMEGQVTVSSTSDTYSYDSVATALSTSPHSVQEVTGLLLDSEDTGPLRSMPWDELERLSSSTQGGDTSGEPVWWAKWNRRFRLFPWPDSSYTLGIMVSLRHGEMSADADTPLIPLQHRHSVLVPYAAALLLSQEGGADAWAEHDHHMARYREAFGRLRNAHGAGHPPTFNVVAPTFGWNLP